MLVEAGIRLTEAEDAIFLKDFFLFLCNLHTQHGAWTHNPETKNRMLYWLSHPGATEEAIYNEKQTIKKKKKKDGLYPLTISIDQTKCGNYRNLQLMSL